MSDLDPVRLVEPAAIRVRDPVYGGSAWAARIIRNPRMEGGVLVVETVFPPAVSTDDRAAVAAALVENLRGLGYGGEISIVTSEEDPRAAQPHDHGHGTPQGHDTPEEDPRKPIEGVKRVILVASGKGGVGKSTVSVNLAVGLGREGYAVGLLDADVYGPSIPRMLHVQEGPRGDGQRGMVPPVAHGIKCISSGMLVDDEQAIIWRGPMVVGLIKSFLHKTVWGDLDYLVVDLPPGTGDAQLSLVQDVVVDGAVVVTTPQEVALADARRGVSMFGKLDVPVLGLVENMAYYALPDGTRDYVFGQGGGRALAEASGVDLIAEVPLQTALRQSGDDGAPAVLGDGPLAEVFRAMVRSVADKMPPEVSS